MTTMRILIERLEEGASAWTPAEETACFKLAKQQIATHGYRWNPRVDVSSSTVVVDALVKGLFNGREGTLVIEVSRGRTGDGSQMEAGASFQTGKKWTVEVVAFKPIPQTKEKKWPPDAFAFGLEAGDMLVQIYEMAIREGFSEGAP